MKLTTAMQILATIAERNGGEVPDYLLADWETRKPAAVQVPAQRKKEKKEPLQNEMQRRNAQIVQNFLNGRR